MKNTFLVELDLGMTTEFQRIFTCIAADEDSSGDEGLESRAGQLDICSLSDFDKNKQSPGKQALTLNVTGLAQDVLQSLTIFSQ